MREEKEIWASTSRWSRHKLNATFTNIVRLRLMRSGPSQNMQLRGLDILENRVQCLDRTIYVMAEPTLQPALTQLIFPF